MVVEWTSGIIGARRDLMILCWEMETKKVGIGLNKHYYDDYCKFGPCDCVENRFGMLGLDLC